MSNDPQSITAPESASTPLAVYANYQPLLEALDGIVWEADAQTFEFSFVSDSVVHILGYTPEEWLNDADFWNNHIYQKDRDQAVRYCQAQTRLSKNHTFDYRMIKSDGSIAWIKDIVSVVSEYGQPKWLRGIMLDITEAKLLADLDHLEKEVLELHSNQRVDIETVLEFYVQGIEDLFPRMKCSVLRVADGRLYNWTAPSLPKEYVAAINDLEVGPNTGSCGTAAYLGERVIVSDIEHDEKWGSYKQFALPHNLRACWSCPIKDSGDKVVAVFGIYYDAPKLPSQDEVMIIERSAAILKVIIENRLYARMMQEMNLLVTQGQELANFGTWQWDIVHNKVSWSSALYNIYGLDEQTFRANFEGYVAMLHPQDQERVTSTIQGALQDHKDVTFEERIIRPDGSVRHLKSWGRVLTDETGKPSKMIGACLDITLAKLAESKMHEIAWMQSHVVRAPLARLMGLVYLLEEHATIPEQTDLMDGIMQSAHELDKIIRTISDNTRL